MNKVLIIKEEDASETRVAMVPEDVKKIKNLGYEVSLVSKAGVKSGFSDEEYEKAGAVIVKTKKEGFERSEIVLRIGKPDDADEMKEGTLSVSFLDPFNSKELLKKLAEKGINAFSLEMIPRSSLAQSMDVLSSQTSLAGYAAVINAAARMPKVFPMMMTSAGTIQPARVFVIGVGVAGLQAIATAKRLGARVEAFDTRVAVAEQVKSLGASFVKIDLGETGETAQGYAKELTKEQLAKQKESQTKVLERSNLVITTAKVFGRKAPLLISDDMLERMQPGSVVVDMAVSTGGNVAGSKMNECVVRENGVVIMSGDGLEKQVPFDASRMLSGNLSSLLTYFFDKEKKEFVIKSEDEIMKSALITRCGKIIHERFKD